MRASCRAIWPARCTLMQMALDATSAHDPESQAWHHAQLGDLH